MTGNDDTGDRPVGPERAPPTPWPGAADALPGEHVNGSEEPLIYPTVPTPRPASARAARTTTTPPSRRIRGLDVARALAIIGMVMVHFGPSNIDVDDPTGFVYETSHGRASILFIVLAGVGVSLLAGDRSETRLAGTTRRLIYRSVVLFPMGMALQSLDTRVAVILQYYAVFFLIALAVVRLRDRVLLVGSAIFTVAAPTLYVAAWFARPEWFSAGGQPDLSQAAELTRAILLTGYYPALVWAAPLLFGMWLGRQDLRSSSLRWRFLIGGAATAAVVYPLAWFLTNLVGPPPANDPSWRWLVVAEPHSEMPLWLLGSTAVAVAILGACLLLADAAPRLMWPLTAAGQLALSIYVGHLLVLAWFPQWLVRNDVVAAPVSVARFTVIAVALATAWRAVADRGPLEWVLHLPFQWGARRS